MKKLAIALAICLMVVMAGSVAFAKAVKIDLVSIDLVKYPDAEGKAVLNYAKGADKTEIQINCSGLIAGDDYVVYLKTNGFSDIGEFTAGPNGKGNFHARQDGDVSGLTVAVNHKATNATVVLGP